MIEKNYAGLDGFVWWMGVVESRQDPLEMGRCQVRVFGWHSPSLGDIPSEDLPWAIPINSVNSAGFNILKEGDFVFGFFSDGRNAQIPLILGVLPSFLVEKSNLDAGFNDLRTPEDLAAAPKKVISRTYSKTGTGATVTEEPPENYPKSRDLDAPSTTGLARNAPNETHVVTSRKERGPIAIPSTGKVKYSTPAPSYAPRYPYNNAMETESGHSMEFDDTPGAERIELDHRSGTMFEIQPNGTKVEEIVKDNYSVVMGDDYVYVMGKAIVSVDKDCTIKVTGNMKIQVGGDLDISAGGDVKISSGKDTKIASSDDVKINAKKTASLSGTSSARVSSTGRMAVSGGATSITSASPIKASQMSIAGKVSATGVASSASAFTIPSLPAIPSGIEEFQKLMPDLGGLTAQLTQLTEMADIQSLMGGLDVAQLDSVLELANAADIGKLVGSLGGEFGVAQLMTGVSPMGMAALVGGLNPATASLLSDQITALAGDIAGPVTKNLMDKLPVGKVQEFASKLTNGKLSQLTSLMDGAGLNKLMSGVTGSQLKDLVKTFAPAEVRNVLNLVDGANINKIFNSLDKVDTDKIKSQIGFDLQKTIDAKMASAAKKYPITLDFDI